MMAAERDSDTELRELYRELILDHARHPRNFGTLDSATHTARGINPLCGDKLTLYLAVDADGTIGATAFEGSGCAISVASASLMTELVRGIPAAAARGYFETVTRRLTGAAADAGGEDPALARIRALDGVREFPSRVKCATLAWHALDSALGNASGPVTTE
ncbi:MAG: SUF system NifU family Fe-S cluster assembly protein [Woeseiaceae bacterium]|nr:SUF system NifU family Fe-S cluster assembly protein [Woeseiaceae bacterium]